MKDWRSQSHVRWDCKYHVVILPKYRQRKFLEVLDGGLEGFSGNCVDRKGLTFCKATPCRTISTCC
jgi:putative transposase